MKKTVLTFLISCVFLGVFAQGERKGSFKLPEVTIQDIDGKPFQTKQIDNGGNPILLTFWATWCKPCLKEHDAISELYDDWKKETGVKIYAVSIDDMRSSKRVKPMVNGKGWEFEVLLDPNGELKRLMNVNVPPHVFVLNGKKEIVWQHVGYLEGDEAKYIDVLRKVKSGKSVE